MTTTRKLPSLPQPHGGKLVERLVGPERARMLRTMLEDKPALTLSPREASDVELMGVGALSPLTGFMAEKDYRGVLYGKRLAGGLPWTLPVTLAPPASVSGFSPGDLVALRDGAGKLMAALHLSEIYRVDPVEEARLAFGTDSPEHPGVAQLLAGGPLRFAGEVDVIELPPRDELRLTPRETREAFLARGWRTVVAFQTRNPVHRAHEYLQKVALELVDGLLLHPLVGATKGDDVPADVRLECYKVLLDKYYPKERVLLATFPAAMRYAGPREAVWHAILRKNYGCTHFIVGRDHAGVGKFYGSYDAQAIFDEFDPAELGIIPLRFENSFFCRDCGQMASSRTCPHGDASHVALSGTRVRELLAAGELPPPEFSRPEVAQVLVEAYRARAQKAAS
ncbi:MAG TPA: sulfate adenylyltransferase [Myxococcales bacterium]|nr:sulfate adenylyltransferase [Myxococcales bacterium]